MNKMFIVLTVKDGICYFEAPEIDKYTHVAVVDITCLDTAQNKCEENIDDLIEAEITGDPGE